MQHLDEVLVYLKEREESNNENNINHEEN